MNGNDEQPASADPRGSKLAGWAVIAVLCALLVGAGALGYFGWFSTDTNVPDAGYIALAFGVVFSLVVGVGLMALVFYSSRKGYDEPAVLVQEGETDPDDARGSPDSRS